MNEPIDLNEFHWLLAIVQSIDVGVVVFDEDYRVLVWNTFMPTRTPCSGSALRGGSGAAVGKLPASMPNGPGRPAPRCAFQPEPKPLWRGVIHFIAPSGSSSKNRLRTL